MTTLSTRSAEAAAPTNEPRDDGFGEGFLFQDVFLAIGLERPSKIASHATQLVTYSSFTVERQRELPATVIRVEGPQQQKGL